MEVLAYILVFIVFVLALGVCGYLSESEKAVEVLEKGRGFLSLALNVALFALMFPARMIFGVAYAISGRERK